ncbi:MAG TPA: hypothetical protein VN622_09195 [Clostridia bacterium]|nr:hypothetical protein [Clostridia bacterium]
MERFASRLFVSYVIILVALSLVACGGSQFAEANKVAKVTVAPATLSMNKGDVVQLTPVAVDASDAQVLAQFSYTSNNPEVLSVSTAGNVCAGKWDANFIVCTPAATVGSAEVTITSQSVSTKVPGVVHEHVDIVSVIPPPAGCISAKETQQLTAKAFSKDAAACARLNATVPCELPAATLGQFTWTSTDLDVVTIDNTVEKSGLATAGIPGRTTVYAALSSNHSPSVNFTTCPVASLAITVKDSTAAPFTVEKATTKVIEATAIDSKNKTLDNVPISWSSSQPFAMSITSSSATPQTGSATANAAGTSTLVASCVPSTCNRNLDPVFSNPIIATISGTAAGTVYVGSTSSTKLIPVDVATNTAGTAITLPRAPNSILINRQGTKGILGADADGIMLLDTALVTVQTLGVSGRVVAFSYDGSIAVISNAAANSVTFIDVPKGSVSPALSIPGGIKAAEFTPDNRYLFMVGNNRLYVLNLLTGLTDQPLGATPSGVASLANGPAAYVTIPGAIQARATCNGTVVDTQTAANPTLVAAIPNGDGVLAYDSPNIVHVSSVNATQTCPPTLTESSNTVDLLGGSVSARQLLVTPDSKFAFITNDSAKLLSYDLSAKTAKTITLAAGAAESYTQGVTLDGKTLYVGAKDGTLHRIDVATLADVQQIIVGLTKADNTAAVPDLVAMRNK